MRWQISFTGKGHDTPTALTVEAETREAAWDAFKRATSLRRYVGDTAPVVEPLDDVDDVATEAVTA